MTKVSKLLVISMLLAVLSMLVVPATAQDDEEIPGPGEGLPIIYPNLGQDIATLNPILSSDGSSNRVIARIFPDFLGIDPDLVDLAPGVPASLVTDFQVSEDGLVYTFTLRDDWTWSDGTPITAADYKYSFDAIASGETDTSLTYVLADIAAVDAPDDQTVVITLTESKCSALTNIAAITPVPSHVYSAEFETFADMNDSNFNLSPQPATAERWLFRNFRPGEQVTLVADENYPDGYLGYVVPEGWVFRNIASTNLIVEEFLAGNITYLQSAPSERKEEIRALGEAGEIQVYEAPASTVRFLAFNIGDPENPQPGLDENGDPIDQGSHPILGDVRVRQALMLASDWEEINQAVFAGEGIQLASSMLPTSWAFDPDIPFYPFDQEQAIALLEEVGWVDDDGDPSTPRVAQGVEGVEDGTVMQLDYITNAGNDEQEAMGVLLADQWSSIGIGVDFQPIDFNTLVDQLLSQQYDMISVFWGFSTIPPEPDGDIRTIFGVENDVPGGGFNTNSYYNPELQSLLDMANDPAQTNNCDTATRADMYAQALQIIRDDVPWYFISTSIVTSAMQSNVENFDPRPGLSFWNEDAYVIEPQER